MKKPVTTEIATTPSSRRLASRAIGSVYTSGLVENPDNILRAKGHNLDVYREILRDDQVTSCYQQRFLALLGKEWQVDAASESAQDQAIAEFVREQIKRINFDDVTRKMLYGLHYGWAVGEILWASEDNRIVIDKIKVKDRAKFKFDEDNNLYFIQQGGEAKPMPDNKFWLFNSGADTDDNPYGLGLAHSLYWPTFFKRNGIKFWLIFLEKFGMPTAMAKLPGAQIDDPNEKEKALEVLEAIQADSGVVCPDNLIVDLVEASRSGTADYNAMCDRMDAAIAKVILSQTMTTDSGSSYSQAKVHSDVKDELIKADADLICDSFNKQVIKPLIEYNFPGAEVPRVWRKVKDDEDLEKVAERDNKIMALGFEPSEQYIKETYGEGWSKKASDMLPPKNNNVPPMGADFADVTALTQKRVNHRQDQQALIEGAQQLAEDYAELYGDKIQKLIGLLEETDDVGTFQRELDLLFSEAPSQAQAQKIAKATFVSRLMGLFKGTAA